MEAVEVDKKEKEVEEEEEKEEDGEEEGEKEGTGGMGEGKEVKEVKNQGEKNYNETYQQKEVREVEYATEREDMKRKEWIRGEMKNVEKGGTGENVKGGKRNSFRLNYITHMIRR